MLYLCYLVVLLSEVTIHTVCNFQSMKSPVEAFSQNSFVISPGLLYHLIRRDSGRLANDAFTSNPIVSSKQ